MKRAIFSTILLMTLLVSTATEAAWQQEWERTLAAAKKEGTVAVLGPRQTQARDILTAPFTKKYGIAVEYVGGSGRVLSPRISTERKAGHYNWDVFVGGTTTGLTAIIPMGAADPFEPALILPEVKNTKYWRKGAFDFADSGRRQFIFSPFQRGTIFYNTKLVAPGEFKSHKQLLDPKWKGKLVMDDPRKPGPGQATFTFFYLHPELGPDFIRALGKQQILILKDFRQQVDFIARGRYPVLIGTSDASVVRPIKQGLPVAIVPASQLKEGTDISPAVGAVISINRAPHPNAGKIFINWLLGKEGQTAFVRGMAYISARVDVPTDHEPSWRIPQPGAVNTYDEKAIASKKELIPLLREVFGKR